VADSDRDKRFGHLLVQSSRFGLGAIGFMCLGFLGYVAFGLITGSIRGPQVAGALVGGLLFLLGGLAILYKAARFRVAQDGELVSGVLLLSSSRWTVQLTPPQVERVVQLRRNPLRREWPLRAWRHWIRLDVVSRGDRGIDFVYLVWRADPVAYFEELRRAGFPTQGEVEPA